MVPIFLGAALRSLWGYVGPGLFYGVSDRVSGRLRRVGRAGFMDPVSTVDACVGVIEAHFKTAPMSLVRRIDDTKYEPASDHYLDPIFSVSPNGTDTPVDWIGILAQEYERTGNALGLIFRDRQRRVEAIQPVRRMDVRLVYDEQSKLPVYVYGGREYPFDIQYPPFLHVTQNRVASPYPFNMNGDFLFGRSPVSRARDEILASAYGIDYFKDMMRLGGRGQVAIIGPLATIAPKTQEDYDKESKRISEVLSEPENRGTVPLLPKGTDVKHLAEMQQDRAFLLIMRYSDEKVCALYKVPLHYINNMERATYDNIREVVRHFVGFTMLNKFKSFESAFKRQVIGYNRDNRDIYLRFEHEELLRGDPKSFAEYVAKFAQLGSLTVDEVRSAYGKGLDPLGPNNGGDDRFIGKTRVSGKRDGGNDSGDNDGTGDNDGGGNDE